MVVGFALESASAGMPAAIDRGRRKLDAKSLDAVVVNLHDAVGSDEAEFVLCYEDGREESMKRASKQQAAARIVSAAVELWKSRNGPVEASSRVEGRSK